MDGTRFDTAAKALARGMTRRTVIKGLFAGLGTVAVSRTPAAALTCTPPGGLNYCNADSECCDNGLCRNGICQCPTGEKICGTGCIPLAQTCGPTYCPVGFRTCGGTCIDITRDSRNCGSCGVTCGVGKICSNSHCCGKGLVFCSGACRLASTCPLIT